MAKSTKEIIDYISTQNYSLSTQYKFPKNFPNPQKYIDGRLSTHNWISELCYYFQQKDKHLLDEFKSIIQAKRDELNILRSSDYKSGAMDGFKEIEDIIKNIKQIDNKND